MLTQQEWLDKFRLRRVTASSSADLDRELLRQYDEIIRDVLNAAIKECPPRNPVRSEANASYDQGCQHYKQDLLKLLHSLPEIK